MTFYMKAWQNDLMSKLLMDDRTKSLGILARNYVVSWSRFVATSETEELDLPDVVHKTGERVFKFCQALAALMAICLPQAGSGIDVQYFKKYKGSEQFERMVRNAFTKEGSMWQDAYDDIVRTAASSRLAAPKLDHIHSLLKDGASPSPDDLCEAVATLAEIKTGLRKGSTAELETSLHRRVMVAAHSIITKQSASGVRPTTIDAILRALTGPLAPFAGSIQKADALKEWMTSKVSEIHEEELMEVVLKPIISQTCRDLESLDPEKLAAYVKSLAGVALNETCVSMLHRFYFKVLSLLHREASSSWIGKKTW